MNAHVCMCIYIYVIFSRIFLRAVEAKLTRRYRNLQYTPCFDTCIASHIFSISTRVVQASLMAQLI